MPAIQLERLRRQSSELAQSFGKPETFIHQLESIFEYYSDHTSRPSQAGKPPPLLVTYKIPNPVMRQILRDLKAQAIDNSEAALNLVEVLWSVPKFEFRLLAIQIMGTIPPENNEEITNRLVNWVQGNQEELLFDSLADQGLIYLRNSHLNFLIEEIGKWVAAKQINLKKLGVRALTNILIELHYENLPVIYRMIKPLIVDAPKQLRSYLLELILQLIPISAPETAQFLKEILESKNSKTTIWLIRRSIEHFPDEIGINLRSSLREQRK